MIISPNARKIPFSTQLIGGYNRKQVNNYIQELQEAYGALTQKSVALASDNHSLQQTVLLLKQENSWLHDQVKELESKLADKEKTILDLRSTICQLEHKLNAVNHRVDLLEFARKELLDEAKLRASQITYLAEAKARKLIDSTVALCRKKTEEISKKMRENSQTLDDVLRITGKFHEAMNLIANAELLVGKLKAQAPDVELDAYMQSMANELKGDFDTNLRNNKAEHHQSQHSHSFDWHGPF